MKRLILWLLRIAIALLYAGMLCVVIWGCYDQQDFGPRISVQGDGNTVYFISEDGSVLWTEVIGGIGE